MKTQSVLDAIRDGDWDFEPTHVSHEKYTATKAIPGSEQKIAILAERVKLGLPLWHPSDRRAYNDHDAD